MKAWTARERNRALQWRNHGRTPAYIARNLGRSVNEVEAMLDTVSRGNKPKTTARACMTCRAEFMREGPHHRMCAACRHASAAIPASMLAIGTGCRVTQANTRG